MPLQLNIYLFGSVEFFFNSMIMQDLHHVVQKMCSVKNWAYVIKKAIYIIIINHMTLINSLWYFKEWACIIVHQKWCKIKYFLECIILLWIISFRWHQNCCVMGRHNNIDSRYIRHKIAIYCPLWRGKWRSAPPISQRIGHYIDLQFFKQT